MCACVCVCVCARVCVRGVGGVVSVSARQLVGAVGAIDQRHSSLMLVHIRRCAGNVLLEHGTVSVNVRVHAYKHTTYNIHVLGLVGAWLVGSLSLSPATLIG